MHSRLLPAVAATFLAACAADTPVAPEAARRPVAPAATGAISVVMSGLNSPRGLDWGPEGALYVAEAGTAAHTGQCVTLVRGSNCYSGTGSISRLWRGTQERVVTGLPSAFNTIGDIIGPNDISFVGRGNARVTIGWGGDPAFRQGLGALGEQFGHVLTVQPSGGWHVTADVSAFERATNPAGGPFDSNPFGLLSEPGQMFVADAGGNSLVHVALNGDVSLVATFPPIPVPAGPFNPPFAQSEAVPTEVTRGPDGALYVSQLTGLPFRPAVSSIFRVVPGQPPTVYASGFTQVTDHAWAPDGSLYVVQYASAPFFGGPGALVRVAPNGTRTTITTALTHPTGVTVGPDGAIYVSNKGDQAAVGEVLRIEP